MPCQWKKTVNPRKHFSDLELTTLDAVFVSSQGNPNRAVVGSSAKALKLSEKQTAPSDQDILTDEAESAVAHSNKENSKDEKPSIVTNPEETPPLSGSQETEPPLSFNIQSALEKEELVDHIRGAIYGNCIGDAIGLLTEFMSKSEAANIYADHDQNKGLLGKLKDRLQSSSQRRASLEYDMKYADFHRCRWETGDWTDDSDQMILILLSLLDNKGKMVPKDFARKMKKWSREGFPELGDKGGMGIGRTTYGVLRHPDFQTDPHHAAEYVWEASGRFVAPNGGVMRTSILGVHDFGNIDTVIANTKAACKVTHADPRCIASCVAVTTAIAMMLQGKHFVKESKSYDVKAVMKDAYEYARDIFETVEEEKELEDHMFAKSLDDLQLDGEGKIGYTFKCLGAGFWSLRQDDFRESLEAVTFEAGDADTNGAVAGALLGCKLGASKLPESWLSGLKHKKWLDVHIDNFLALLGLKD
ncbi:hypothetical protein OS493_037901 [Desmophyllum pertusum]|uniref:ADP-ribosylglycohydrolase n=1 Tax=Desmophyllum pertusum TaxID=174260 RepID=A0A9W9Z8H6_9CNID|nr:hypothetical protein OS493_037901 [Desmophyllum pertusum]